MATKFWLKLFELIESNNIVFMFLRLNWLLTDINKFKDPKVIHLLSKFTAIYVILCNNIVVMTAELTLAILHI